MRRSTRIPAQPLSLGAGVRRVALAGGTLLAVPFLLLLAGCGTSTVIANPVSGSFALSPATAAIDTNCTGCNATAKRGAPVYRFAVRLPNGEAAPVTWSVSGGDAAAGAGSISATGDYSPPGYLTADQAQVVVTARLASDPRVAASAQVTVTPGFLQPLTPENVALGANGTVTVTGRLAVAGGSAGIQFALGNAASDANGGLGSLGVTTCQRSSKAFTACTVTYTAPSTIASTDVTYLVARPRGPNFSVSLAKTDLQILLNTSGVTSNPAAHQAQLPTLMPLGSSGGNNNDFDAHGNVIADCCSGTLGALVQDNSGKQYLLSNNHVLARSDHAAVGDAIVQPGLIDNNCTPSGEGAGTVPVGALTAWLPLKSPQTNADAALAQVASRTLDATGSILELGVRQSDGTLAAAPPGISSSNGKGEAPGLQMRVAKSGRTTGLTCASVSAVSLDVSVDYYRDCAETKPYLTKFFTNQVAVSGDRFSDAGDSGALVVDTSNAEPVGLFFAGGTDSAGVGQGVANPANDVLSELGAQAGAGTSYTFVGGADHGVSCLSYGDSTIASAQGVTLSNEQIASGQRALAAARLLVNPSAGILGVGMGKSSDHPSEAAVIVYVDEGGTTSVPDSVEGVRTMVIPTTARAVSMGTAPLANMIGGAAPLPASALSQALATKRQVARSLMAPHAAFFGVGVGQSLDNPRDAALVIYVDQARIPDRLPQTINGLRTRYVVMDRLHVTRSYATTVQSTRHCLPATEVDESDGFDPANLREPLRLNLF
ncbi:MAG TPA: hypothetical protein VGG62_09150 [Terracidiphilus sp.]